MVPGEVSEPQPEVRDAVIDLATQKYPLEFTPRTRPARHDPPAEQNLANRITQEPAATARRVMTAAYRDPEPAAHEIHFVNDGPDPDMSLYEGLPVTDRADAIQRPLPESLPPRRPATSVPGSWRTPARSGTPDR